MDRNRFATLLLALISIIQFVRNKPSSRSLVRHEARHTKPRAVPLAPFCDPWTPATPPIPAYSGKRIDVPNVLGSIQAAIDSVDTYDGDILVLDAALGVYTTNVPINVYKKVKITSKDQAASVSSIMLQQLFNVSIGGVTFENIKMYSYLNVLSSGVIFVSNRFGGTTYIENCTIVSAVNGVFTSTLSQGTIVVKNCDMQFNSQQNAFNQYAIFVRGGSNVTIFVDNCRLNPQVQGTNPRSYMIYVFANITEALTIVAKNCSNALSQTTSSRGFILIDGISSSTSPISRFYLDGNNFENCTQPMWQIFGSNNSADVEFVSATNNNLVFGRPAGSSFFQNSLVFFATSGNLASDPPVVYLKDNVYELDPDVTFNPATLAAGTNNDAVTVGYGSLVTTLVDPIPVSEPPACGIKNVPKASRAFLPTFDDSLFSTLE